MSASLLSATTSVVRQPSSCTTSKTATRGNLRSLSGGGEQPCAGPPALGPIAGVLKALPRFKRIVESLDAVALADIEESLDWYGVPGGTTLFRQGDPAQDAFILVTGRLGVFLDSATGMRLIAQIAPGELVGEIALISGAPRSATVVALRDSEVVRIPRQSADRLFASSPELMQYVLRLLASRLERSSRPPVQQATRAVAVVPLDDRILQPAFVPGLRRAFASLSPRVGLFDSRFANLTTEAFGRIEERHDLVLYVADRRRSSWSARCLRQA